MKNFAFLRSQRSKPPRRSMWQMLVALAVVAGSMATLSVGPAAAQNSLISMDIAENGRCASNSAGHRGLIDVNWSNDRRGSNANGWVRIANNGPGDGHGGGFTLTGGGSDTFTLGGVIVGQTYVVTTGVGDTTFDTEIVPVFCGGTVAPRSERASVWDAVDIPGTLGCQFQAEGVRTGSHFSGSGSFGPLDAVLGTDCPGFAIAASWRDSGGNFQYQSTRRDDTAPFSLSLDFDVPGGYQVDTVWVGIIDGNGNWHWTPDSNWGPYTP